MNPNPFSPSFAIRPSSFFGRTRYLDTFTRALETPDSANRFFVLTGTRASGKTSLLQQYKLRAESQGWKTLKTTNIDVLDRLAQFAKIDTNKVKRDTLEPKITVGEISGSLGSHETITTQTRPLSMLGSKLAARIRSTKGLAIIVDETQKIERDAFVRIANAVQDVKNEGLPIALVLGGLPNTYNKIRRYSSCTFIRRIQREKLWTMGKSETFECLRRLFARVPELQLSSEQMGTIAQFTGGHPYLIQLVGDYLYRLVEQEIDPVAGMQVPLSDGFIEEAEARSLSDYKRNVLDDVMTGAHTKTVEYIHAAYEVSDEHGFASVAAINERFGRTAQQMSSRRDSALNTQVIKAAERGKVKFALPHYRYIFELYEHEISEVEDDEWDY